MAMDVATLQRRGMWLAVIGVALVVLGVGISQGIRMKLRDAVNSAVVIDSVKSPGYNSWLRTNDGTDPFYKYNVYVFNITNIEDVVQNGEQPIVKQLGPYLYEKVVERVDVSFQDDGKIVSTKDVTSYHFQGENSPNDDSDIIYQVNPAYLAAVYRPVGPSRLTEVGLISNLFSGFIASTLTSLQTGLTPKVYGGAFPSTVATWKGNAVAYAYGNVENNFLDDFATSATQVDLSVLAAGTPGASIVGSQEWQLRRMSSLPGNINGAQSSDSGITRTLASALFTSTTPYSLTNQQTSSYWIKAASGDKPAQDLLKTNFGLSDVNLIRLLNWVNSFLLQRHNNILKIIQPVWVSLGYQSSADIPYLQLGSLGALGGASLYNLGEAPFYVEFAGWKKFVDNSGNPAFSVSRMRTLIDGNSCAIGGFSQANTTATFYRLLSENKYEEVMSCFGFQSTAEILLWNKYIEYVMGSTLLPVCKNYGCLWKKTTVRNMVFGTQPDPFLTLLKSAVNKIGIITNSTKEQRQAAGENVNYTGKKGLSRIRDYIKYYGKDSLTRSDGSNLWGEEVKVQCKEISQFKPDRSPDDLCLFSSTLTRPINLKYKEDYEVHSINLRRYILDGHEIASGAKNPDNVKYYYNIDGVHNYTTYEFLPGVTGLPFYVTLPHMLYADSSFSSQVKYETSTGSVIQGMQPDKKIHEPFLSIDPITGATMDARLGVQFVTYFGPESARIFNSPLLFKSSAPHAPIPVLWSTESSQITKDQSDDYHASVTAALTGSLVILIVLVVLGGILLITGIAFIIKAHFLQQSGKGTQDAGDFPMTSVSTS